MAEQSQPLDPRLRRALAQRLGKGTYEAICKLCAMAGCHVYRLAQARRTRQTPGLPDLWIFGPRRGQRAWIESKAGSGRLSPEQRLFQERCAFAELDHVAGDLEAVEALLLRWGVVRRLGSGLLQPVREPL